MEQIIEKKYRYLLLKSLSVKTMHTKHVILQVGK